MWRAVRFAAGGALLGVVGALQHNAVFTLGSWTMAPVGLVLVLLAIAAYSVWARAAGGIACHAAQAFALLAVAFLSTIRGPGGDVLVPQTTRSTVWLAGTIILPLIISILPPRWFATRSNGLLDLLRSDSAEDPPGPTQTGVLEGEASER